jgi:hypothetical protein
MKAQTENTRSLCFETIAVQNIKIPEHLVKFKKRYLANQNQNQNQNYPLPG